MMTKEQETALFGPEDHEGKIRPDAIDEINAFRAGFRHGVDRGIVSPREAEEILKSLPTTIPICGATVDCFGNGADDGARGDKFRYLLSFTVAP